MSEPSSAPDAVESEDSTHAQEPSLGEVYPALRYLVPLALDAHELGAITGRHNPATLALLQRHHCTTVAELAALRSDDIMGWPHVGVGKRDRILAFADDLDTNALAVLTEAAGFGRAAEVRDPDLRLLASWGRFAANAGTWGAVHDSLAEGSYPDDVAAALAAVRGRPVGTIPPEPEADAVLADWVAGLAERERAILRGRLVEAPSRTLADIGEEFDVTRERIRQLQVKVTDAAQHLLATDVWRPVRWEVFAVQQRFGALAPLSAGEAADLSSPEGFPRALVLWLAGYRREGTSVRREHFALPGADAVPRLEKNGLAVDEPALHHLLAEGGVEAGLLDWASDQIDGLHRIDGHLVRWLGNIVDKSRAVLEVRGIPLTPEVLAEAIGGGISVRGLRGRLYEDPNLVRATRKTVGLKTWGGPEYTSVVALMCEDLERHGSRVVSELAEEIADQFGVSPASVPFYAYAPVFVLESGTVRLRQADEPFVPRNEPRRVRGLYRLSPDVYVWNVVADHDLLRGSGRALPSEIAVFLGLEPGSRITLSNPVRDVPVSWLETSHTGPNIGSLKALAEACHAARDDVVHVRFTRSDHAVEMTPRAAAFDAESASEQIARLTGLPASGCLDRTTLAQAVASKEESVVDDLLSRGDDDIAALVGDLEAGDHG